MFKPEHASNEIIHFLHEHQGEPVNAKTVQKHLGLPLPAVNRLLQDLIGAFIPMIEKVGATSYRFCGDVDLLPERLSLSESDEKPAEKPAEEPKAKDDEPKAKRVGRPPKAKKKPVEKPATTAKKVTKTVEPSHPARDLTESEVLTLISSRAKSAESLASQLSVATSSVETVIADLIEAGRVEAIDTELDDDELYIATQSESTSELKTSVSDFSDTDSAIISFLSENDADKNGLIAHLVSEAGLNRGEAFKLIATRLHEGALSADKNGKLSVTDAYQAPEAEEADVEVAEEAAPSPEEIESTPSASLDEESMGSLARMYRMLDIDVTADTSLMSHNLSELETALRGKLIELEQARVVIEKVQAAVDKA